MNDTIQSAATLEEAAPVGQTADVIPDTVPILPIRNAVIFPSTIYPVSAGSDSSRQLVKDSGAGNRTMGAMTLKDPGKDTPSETDLYPVGTVCRMIKMIQTPDGGMHVILQGLERFRIKRIISEEPYLKADIEVLNDEGVLDHSDDALIYSVRQNAIKMVNLISNIPPEAAIIISNIEDSKVLLDMISMNLDITIEEKVRILSELNIRKRAEMVNMVLARELEMVELSHKINESVKSTIDKSQREYYLREQLKAIQRELGEVDENAREIEELREKLAEAGMPDDIRKTAEEEIGRLSRVTPASPEYPMLRNYVDLLLELPWSKSTDDNLDIVQAEEILNADHYDLESAKKRILEYLSVRKLNAEIRGPILCFIGPPGTGKTSLGHSIARALGRKFVRMSLGGIHDEAEIRGHRRTYIGALPGRIIQGIRKAGSNNPLFMLDEIDKIGMDYRGDPTSALLEVLDPEQNFSFADNYLGVPFNLSRVMFICTGNDINAIPGPLQDRMEVLTLPGYTGIEKLQIAKRYLVKRQLAENGLREGQIHFQDSALLGIIDSYTREAGVRSLEREIANSCRVAARKIATGEPGPFTITMESLNEYLGPAKYFMETVERTKIPGVAVGLAWTPVGGAILFIEAGKMTGSGNLLLTGKLGDIMKESALAALSYTRSKSHALGVQEDFFKLNDIHIHIPAGAVPKDGPSAGVALFSALLSLLKDQALPYNVAMTGEITLRGIVLPVGGIKEKIIGAKNAGITTVLIPRKNEKDLIDVPKEVLKSLKILPIDTLDDAVKILFPSPRKRKTRPVEKKRAVSVKK
jgi:ATP-dependent Lon protease